MLFITFSFAYLDRVNFSFASVGGMGRDLHLSAALSSLVGALFFLGYFCGQIPAAIYAERKSAKQIIFVCLLLWGVFSSLTGVVTNITALLIVRFLLGVMEAAVFPSLLIFTNNWFARSERGVANTAIILSTPVTVLWMSVLSGYLVSAFGWRWMFILEGLPASIWGVIWWFCASDHPHEASWVTSAEAAAIEAQITTEQKGFRATRNYGEAFRNGSVIRLATLYFFWGLSLFGFILWLPTIIHESGTNDIVTIGWLTAGPYLVTILAMPVISRISDRLADRRLVVIPCLAASAFSFLLLYAFPAMPFALAYVLMSVTGIGLISAIAPFFAIPPDILPKTIAGTASALINSLGALGGFIGTYLVGWLSSLTHNPTSSFLLMGAALSISVVLLLPRLKPQAA